VYFSHGTLGCTYAYGGLASGICTNFLYSWHVKLRRGSFVFFMMLLFSISLRFSVA
jgi:hypothetical protein